MKNGPVIGVENQKCLNLIHYIKSPFIYYIRVKNIKNKLGLSCAKLRQDSLLSLLFLVNSELCMNKMNKVNQFKGNISSESKKVQVR